MLALSLLLYAPLVAGAATFPAGDFVHHFLPFSLYLQREISSGRLPLWNPYTYSGHPFLADVQAAVWYPVSDLLLLLTLPWQSLATRLYFLQVEAMIHVALAGLFVVLLVRELTGDRWAALIAGAMFALSGYLSGYPPLQLAVLRTAIWLPLVMWCLLRAWAEPHLWRWWVGAALAWGAAFLAGHPQTFLHATYALTAWIAVLWVAPSRARRGWQAYAQRLAGVGVCALLAVGITSAQWLPSWEFLQQSVRANVDYAFVSGGFPIQDTWQLLLPGVLTQFSPLYVGVVGLGLAFVAIFAWTTGALSPGDDSSDRHAPGYPWGIAFFALLTLLALMASYGGNGFLYPLLYRWAPGWGWFRGQERAAYLVAFGLCVLAGYGVAVVPRMHVVARRRAALSYGVLVTAGVYTFGMLWQLPGDTAISPWRYLVVAFVTLVLGLGIALLVWLDGWERRLGLVFALVVANLFWANFGVNLEWVAPARKVETSPEVTALAQAMHSGDAEAGRVYNEYRIYDDYGMVAGVEDVWGSSPLRLARYAALFDQFPLDRMWRLLGVSHVLTWRKELFGPSERLAEFPHHSDATYLHRLPQSPQRVWLATTALAVDDAEAIRRLGDHQFDLDQTALLPIETGLGENPVVLGPGSADSAVATVQRLAPNKLHVRVESESAGLLIIAENWMPGWQVEQATCDDASACAIGASIAELALLEPLRADLTLVGVPVAAGVTEFDLVYRPRSIIYGLAISVTSVAAVGVLALWRARRRNTQGGKHG
jgi:hypothetical protein